MNIAWQNDLLIAIDHDNHLLIFNNGGMSRQFKLGFKPKEISVVNNRFYIL